ncbi:MAG TPA: hypothetical protein ENF64_00840 [Hadesarchaea archaeon]|nr:hypothetical protein [Hadesarchaea archaeon]
MLAAFLVIVFISLLVSAYTHYQVVLSTAGLVDTASSITNQLVLNSLAYESGGNVMEYVIDPDKAASLECREEIGGENFEFQFSIFYNWENEMIMGPYGPAPPEGREISAVSVPVVLYWNDRFEPAKLQVRVWRA